MHDNAHVSFPLFPNDTFSQGAQKSIEGDSDLTSFLATPSSVTTDDISSAVDKVIDKLKSNLIQEALISTGLLLVYVIVVLIGMMRSMFAMALPNRTRGEGGQRYVSNGEMSIAADALTGDNRAPLSPRSPRRRANSDASNHFADAKAAWDNGSLDQDREYYGDEKSTGRAPGGRRAELRLGHWRKSSHGRVEGASGQLGYSPRREPSTQDMVVDVAPEMDAETAEEESRSHRQCTHRYESPAGDAIFTPFPAGCSGVLGI